MAYTPNPPRVVQEMLEAMGLGDIDQLFIDIPGELQLDRELDLGESLSELELRKKMSELAGRNMTTGEYPCFLGAGAYDHYVPAVVEHVLSRSEFVTAYTPYQAELSQGVLQSIFEYQSMICTLTGMDVCNASMFDGGSSVAEACSLAVDATRRKKASLHQIDGLQQLPHPFQGIILTLNGYQNAVRRSESINGKQSQGWRAINKNIVIVVFDSFKGFTQPALAVVHADHLYFSSSQADIGRDQIQVLHQAFNDYLFCFYFTKKQIIDRGLQFIAINTQAACGITLGIGVHKQNPSPGYRQAGTQVNCGSCLGHSALLVSYANCTLH
jgi:hypothetical protein